MQENDCELRGITRIYVEPAQAIVGVSPRSGRQTRRPCGGGVAGAERSPEKRGFRLRHLPRVKMRPNFYYY
jgi:hypothetical protein